MACLSENILKKIKVDLDQREDVIRQSVYEALVSLDKPDLSDSIVVSYFIWAQNLTPAKVGKEICYHMTSGVRHSKSGSLLDQCTGKVVDSVCFDKQQRCGLIRVAFPLKMLQDDEGNPSALTVSHYFTRESRVEHWRFGRAPRTSGVPSFAIPRFPRTLSDYVNGIIRAGFVLKAIEEPRPTEEACHEIPTWQRWRDHAGVFLYFKADKPVG